jgi:hypothetical protein
LDSDWGERLAATRDELREALRERLGDLRHQVRQPWQQSEPWATGATLAALLPLMGRLAADPKQSIAILDHANLVFHEAGHKIYGLLGGTLGLYGGTLGQLTFPVVVAVRFFLRRQPLALALGLAWLFENLLDIARYMASVNDEVVYLVGGTVHDWENIFARWHVLPPDDLPITRAVRVAAWLELWATCGWVAWRGWVDRGARAARPTDGSPRDAPP